MRPLSAPRARLIAAVLVVLPAALLASAPRRADEHQSDRPTLARRAAPTREDTARALHLLERATWGTKRTELTEVLRVGRSAWLERQLHPERIDDGALAARIARFPAAAATPVELYRDYPRPARAARDSAAGRARRSARPQRILVDLAGARLGSAVYSQRQLDDVMADFWFNHFNVYFGKGNARYMVGDYERNAIRPHVFGRFRDMLGATAAHPAMLVYLDNARSIAADSMRGGPARPAGARPRGINENYARELLELHTLGVDGGYTQNDVVDVARAFTGWTVGMGRGAPRFAFRPALHDVGAKTVLGKRLPAGRGEEDGEEVLDLLARHPATARHLGRELARRFVADEPPPRLVAELAAVFLRTDGDLREVTRALFSSAEFNAAEARGNKVKTPFEFVAGALRATDAEVGPSRAALRTLRELGHLPYAATAPTGYPNRSAEWASGGAMLARMNFALALAAGRVDGVRIDPARFAPAEGIAAALLPGRDVA
ncbi:MAG TPA: DUF1800 domain-containing protein, partial [Longimicrobium sp.]|nr:DUF1800 domain-containing protein [Longimicrobium sp.]